MSTSRAVHILNAHPGLRLDRRGLIRVIHRLDAHAERFLGGPESGELSLAFLTDDALARLHGEFLGDPTPTDVITFEGEPAFGTAGEICVSPDTASRFSSARGRDFSEELLLYVVHGWLHLAGYDDRQPAPKRRMRAAEARALSLLRAAGPLPRFRLK